MQLVSILSKQSVGCPLRGHRGDLSRLMQLVSIVKVVCIYLGCPRRGHRGDTSHETGTYCPSSLYI